MHTWLAEIPNSQGIVFLDLATPSDLVMALNTYQDHHYHYCTTTKYDKECTSPRLLS